MLMKQQRPLRVLITGRQEKLDRVLVTNIQRWGYEAILLSSTLTFYERNDTIVEGDLLLYDLDAFLHTTSYMVGRDTPTLYGRSLIAELSRDYAKYNEYGDLSPLPETRFTIALSSHSVSRTSLEQLGAIALLQKPFEMGLLQRYLHILQRLLLSSPHEE